MIQLVTVTKAEISGLAAADGRYGVVGERFTAGFLVAFFGDRVGEICRVPTE